MAMVLWKTISPKSNSKFNSKSKSKSKSRLIQYFAIVS